jgi:hypothetical protein
MWGFSVDSDIKKVTSEYRYFLDVLPSLAFQQSVEAWDAQAIGPLAQRAHPNQEELGPSIAIPPPKIWWLIAFPNLPWEP